MSRLRYELRGAGELLDELRSRFASVAAVSRLETPAAAIEVIFYDGEEDDIEAVSVELADLGRLCRKTRLPGAGARRVPDAPPVRDAPTAAVPDGRPGDVPDGRPRLNLNTPRAKKKR